MTDLKLSLIPEALRSLPQWIVWRLTERAGKPTKMPFHPNGLPAKSDDPKTWVDFAIASEAAPRFTGLGFVFAATDPFCGIDLDGCRDPQTGVVADWAKAIIIALNSYAEVSPSQTGVKIWVIGKPPMDRGRKVVIEDADKIGDKEPAIEIYFERRYFAVTGWRLQGVSHEPQPCQEQLEKLSAKFFPEPTPSGSLYHSESAVVERARKYLEKMPAAVSGQSGHNVTFRAACVLVLGFGLSESDALSLMHDYNRGCKPPWSDRELLHKVRQAAKQAGERGYLRNVPFDRWSSVPVPEYRLPEQKPEPRVTTLADAASAYLTSIRDGKSPLIELGIPDLDYALGGGVERGELVIFAARPSHGKSAVALQCVHHWTARGMPCAIVSEEMSALALGKRTLQFVSTVPQEHWSDLAPQVGQEIATYAESRAPCIILEGCGTSAVVVEAVEQAIERDKIECLVVDYAQLLRGTGRSRYEQMTEVSVTLRNLASKHKIVLLALCQMSRDIEGRSQFKPAMSDLKETGQFEQDADVIVFLCWPWRLDPLTDQNRYQFFVEKNRNRAINQRGVDCTFDPNRQMISLDRGGARCGDNARSPWRQEARQ